MYIYIYNYIYIYMYYIYIWYIYIYIIYIVGAKHFTPLAWMSISWAKFLLLRLCTFSTMLQCWAFQVSQYLAKSIFSSSIYLIQNHLSRVLNKTFAKLSDNHLCWNLKRLQTSRLPYSSRAANNSRWLVIAGRFSV